MTLHYVSYSHPFTSDGVKTFIDSALEDTFRALDRNRPGNADIFVIIGGREIRIPTGADNFGTIEQALLDCLQNEKENGGDCP